MLYYSDFVCDQQSASDALRTPIDVSSVKCQGSRIICHWLTEEKGLWIAVLLFLPIGKNGDCREYNIFIFETFFKITDCDSQCNRKRFLLYMYLFVNCFVKQFLWHEKWSTYMCIINSKQKTLHPSILMSDVLLVREWATQIKLKPVALEIIIQNATKMKCEWTLNAG